MKMKTEKTITGAVDPDVLTYTVGVPHDTAVAYEDGEFRYTHNGYAYALPVAGCRVEETEEGYRLVPTGAVKLDMSKR
jgi:hypothetical protein